MCFGDPMGIGSLCIKLYHLDVTNHSMSGCVDLMPKLAGQELGRIKLGCFKLGQSIHIMERHVAKIYLDSFKNTMYSYGTNLTQSLANFSGSSKNLLQQTYSSLLESLKNIELPYFTEELKPVNLMNTFYNSFFSSKSLKQMNKNSKKQNTDSASPIAK